MSAKYEKFKYNNGYYAYLEVPIADLEIRFGRKFVENVSLTVIKSIDESKAIIRLAERDGDYWMNVAQTSDKLQEWEDWSDENSYSIDDWLTVSQYKTLTASSDYNNE